MDNHSVRPPAASSAQRVLEWPEDFTADHHDQNLQDGEPENIPHPLQHQSSVDDADFNLDSFLEADLNAMYAAQAAADTIAAGSHSQEHSQSHSVPLQHHSSHSHHSVDSAVATVTAGSHSQEHSQSHSVPSLQHYDSRSRHLVDSATATIAAGSRSQKHSQSHSVPLQHHSIHSHYSVDSEQQRLHSHSIVSSSNYVPVTPPLRPSCRFQVHHDGGEGASLQHVGYHTEQHQQYQFIPQSPLQHLQHPLNIHHHHFPMSHAQPAVPSNSFCPLHSNNQPHPFHISYQHPAVLQQPLPQQPVPQQRLPQQRLPQQPLPQQPLPQQPLPQQPLPQQPLPQQPLHYHQAPLFHSHLVPQLQLPQQPVACQPHSFARQSGYIQPVVAKPTHIIFPPIVHQLQKKDSSERKQVLIPVPLPHTNNDDNSKDSPDVSTTPLPSLTPSPLSSLPSTPYVLEPFVSQPPSPAAFSPVPGPSGYNPNSPDSLIRVSHHNVDREGKRRLNLFADRFKETRIRYEYSKQHVAQQISIRYNFKMTELQLQRFENKALSFEDMLVMKIHLEKWLMETLRNRGIHETEIKQLSQWLTSFNQKRKGRTAISVETKRQLLKEFKEDPKPSVKSLKDIAENLGIRFEVVRVWFCNKRAKEKAGKDTGPEDEEEIEEESDSDDESNSDVQLSQ